MNSRDPLKVVLSDNRNLPKKKNIELGNWFAASSTRPHTLFESFAERQAAYRRTSSPSQWTLQTKSCQHRLSSMPQAQSFYPGRRRNRRVQNEQRKSYVRGDKYSVKVFYQKLGTAMISWASIRSFSTSNKQGFTSCKKPKTEPFVAFHLEISDSSPNSPFFPATKGSLSSWSLQSFFYRRLPSSTNPGTVSNYKCLESTSPDSCCTFCVKFENVKKYSDWSKRRLLSSSSQIFAMASVNVTFRSTFELTIVCKVCTCYSKRTKIKFRSTHVLILPNFATFTWYSWPHSR